MVWGEVTKPLSLTQNMTAETLKVPCGVRWISCAMPLLESKSDQNQHLRARRFPIMFLGIAFKLPGSTADSSIHPHYETANSVAAFDFQFWQHHVIVHVQDIPTLQRL